MNIDRDSNDPSLDMVMHIGLAALFLATTFGLTAWPEIQSLVA